MRGQGGEACTRGRALGAKLRRWGALTRLDVLIDPCSKTRICSCAVAAQFGADVAAPHHAASDQTHMVEDAHATRHAAAAARTHGSARSTCSTCASLKPCATSWSYTVATCARKCVLLPSRALACACVQGAFGVDIPYAPYPSAVWVWASVPPPHTCLMTRCVSDCATPPLLVVSAARPPKELGAASSSMLRSCVWCWAGVQHP